MGAYIRRGNLLFDPTTRAQVGYVDLDGIEQLGSLVSGAGISGLKLRSLNVHDLRLLEPMQQLDLPSPYSSTFTGLTNREHAYGTPIYFPNGWRGYRFWMIGAPYPTTVKGTCTISQAAPGVVTYAAHPFKPGMPITFSTTGGLPTGLTTGTPYWVLDDANFSASTFAVSASPGGAAIATTSAGSGTHTASIYASKYENPALYVSNDGENFIPAPGARAPLFDCLSITSGSDLGSYYADPYIVYDPATDKLFIVWCWFGRGGATKSSLLISESSDGATWTTPVEVVNSTSTTFTPNSPSLIRTATGWTMIALDTRDGTGTFSIIISTTTSATPYTGWTAPGAVFSGAWTQASYTHPLARQLWHMFIVGLADGGFVGMAADNNSAGGTAYSLASSDGLTWSVQPFSAWNSAAVGGTWYRPGLCVCNDGANVNLIAYISRTNPLQSGASGFYMQRARVAEGFSQDVLVRQMLRDTVHRNLAAPVALKSAGILAWDSFNRADSATTLGNAESGQTWAYNASNVFGISTNRAYITTTGNSIAVVDVASQNYDVEVQIQTIGTSYFLVFEYVDNLNFWRFGFTGGVHVIQKIVAGTQALNVGLLLTIAAGDVIRVSKRGARFTLFHNDRPIDSYYDTQYAAQTKVGMQASGASPTYFENFIVRAG